MLLCEQVNARPRSMIYVHDSQPKRGKSRRFSNEHSSLSPLFLLPGRLVRVGGPYCEYGRSQPHAGSLARRSATFEPWRVAEHV